MTFQEGPGCKVRRHLNVTLVRSQCGRYIRITAVG